MGRVLLIPLAVLLAVSVGGADATRDLLGPAPYVQCGGTGSGCTGSKCRDGMWPGFKCKTGFKCFRVNSYYWQCDTKQPPMTPTAAYTKSDFHQCGGSGSGCKGTKCGDRAWPQAQGGSCKAGLKCYRVSCYYWQCDTHQPPMSKVQCAKPTAPTLKPVTYPASAFKQCGGKGNGCKGTKCKDARYPLNEGGSCAPGLMCYRKSQWYYGCDTHP